MENTELNKIVLRRKKEKVIHTIILASEYCNLTVPKINFDGCPLEESNELAHYHIGGNKICISERQLMKQNEHDLEETAIHEVIHHLGLMHGSAAERTKFRQIKNYIKPKIWRPDSGTVFKEGEKKIKSQKDMDTSKEAEYRRLIAELEDAKTKEQRSRIINDIFRLKSDEKGTNSEEIKEIKEVKINDKEEIKEIKIEIEKAKTKEEIKKIINKRFEDDYQKFKQHLKEIARQKQLEESRAKIGEYVEPKRVSKIKLIKEKKPSFLQRFKNLFKRNSSED